MSTQAMNDAELIQQRECPQCATLRQQLAAKDAACAEMREALEKDKNTFDNYAILFSMAGLEDKAQIARCHAARCWKALSLDAGKSILARLEKAEGLLRRWLNESDTQPGETIGKDTETFLNEKKG